MYNLREVVLKNGHTETIVVTPITFYGCVYGQLSMPHICFYLRAFGKLQVGDYPSQSLIFDLNDFESYIKNGVEEEIEEIKAYKSPPKPMNLPDDIKQCLNKFNSQSTADIKKVLKNKAGRKVMIMKNTWI